jgi:dephospho-CoA kinase
MLRVGLTGGLGSGKSTVAEMLRALGAHHLDADVIARALIAPGGAAEPAVVARFGAGIVGADGAVDRKALASIVFADPQALAELNAIVHPHVRAALAREFARLAAAKPAPAVVVVDAALLVESGIHRDLDAVIVVACSEATQVARAVARGGLTEPEARARIRAQAPLAEKTAAADYIVDNGGTLDGTRRQVVEIWESLRRRSIAGG